MTLRERVLGVSRGGADNHQENSLAHIGLRTMQDTLYWFLRFEISAIPFYPLRLMEIFL